MNEAAAFPEALTPRFQTHAHIVSVTIESVM